ncbi:MAG: ABC transporter ATP-binding protein/permease [Acidobacteriota bacterium]|nr:ABC transporter ATP-binding protein/permease [Acidobacteriota bacterium]
MPDEKNPPKPRADKKPLPSDDVAGKVYDASLMRRLLAYLKPYKLQAGIAFAAVLVKAASDVAGPYLVKVAVDTYMSGNPPSRGSWLARHLSAAPMTGVGELAALYLAALLFTFLLELLQTYLMQWTGQKIMYDMRSEIYRHLQRMAPAFFDRNPVGRLVTRVTSDVDALNEMFTSGVLAIFDNSFVLLFITLIMVRMSWPLALLTLSAIPAILYVTKIFRRQVRESYRRQRTATAKINSFTQEYVSGMSIVQLFNRERRAFADFHAVNDENKQAWNDAVFSYAWYYPVVELLSSSAIALVLWRGGLAGLHTLHLAPGAHSTGLFRTVTIGVLIAFIQYAQRFFRPIQDLSEKYNILQAAMAASERVFKLLDEEPAIVSPESPAAGDSSGSIEFRDVWFTYQTLTAAQQTALDAITTGGTDGARGSLPAVPHSTGPLAGIEWILRGVSFTIAPGETAAIVGHTGAGKTTITALMMRFYDVQQGRILIDGVDVRDQDLTALRRRFGVVLQDPFLFTGTVADNIRLGSSWITDEALERAAEEVNIADFIRTLPAGFSEPVRERGATLSTGQKQLISFARALAHAPAILILDEATSSVDTETEHRVRLALSRMITGRTSVLIAHRLSTIQSADTILVMHKGTLRERGTHQQLLAHRGLYYKLYQLQYKDQELATPTPIPALTQPAETLI